MDKSLDGNFSIRYSTYTMKNAIQTIILFVKNALIMKRDFAVVHVYNVGVQYSQGDEDGCGCGGNCNC